MKKKIIGLLAVLVLGLTGCQSNDDVITIGLSGNDSAVWDSLAEKLKDEGIEIELKYFSDYILPNEALANGDIDLNAFQTVSFFEQALENNANFDLVPICTTVRSPMGIYSEKHDNVNEVPAGTKISVPNDESNRARSLILLESAGLIKLKEGYNSSTATVADIEQNPYEIEIVELESRQIARSINDVDYAVINDDVAVDAGYSPVEDAIYLEPETNSDYINIIAANKSEKDNEKYQAICEAYQTDENAELIIEDSKGSSIPSFVPLSKIGW